MWKKLYRWLNERTGLESLIRKANDEPIRGGARWAYVFGCTVLLLLVLQAFTGIVLMMHYVPSSDHAHASVAYIQKVVYGGALLRGLHYYGTSAIVILVVLHFAQTFLFGAYKPKRELLWVTGLVMLLLVLALAFTGYLLPWTQEAYFGTKVGASIVGEVPLIGPLVERVMLGGSAMTTLTLSRFFAVHVALLPLILILFAGSHVALFRKAGAAGPYHHRDDTRIETFYPRQLFFDAVFFLLAFVVLFVLSLKLPAALGPQADPSSDYLARPPWYFLPLFQLLKYFPGGWTLIPALVIPGILLTILAVLPFLDRKEERHPLRRPVAACLFLATLGCAGGLIGLSKYQDRGNPEFRAKLESQRLDEQAFMRAPFQPEEIGRSLPTAVPTLPAMAGLRDPALKIYFSICADCHGRDATGGQLGPSLIRLASSQHLSKEFLVRYIAGHSRERASDSMPQFAQLNQEQRSLLADWLLALKTPQQLIGVRQSVKPVALATSSASSIKRVTKTVQPAVQAPTPPEPYLKTCASCHGADGRGNIGPSLVGITGDPQRSSDDLLKLLEDSRSFGLKDPMPASFPKLTQEEKKAIIEWLSKLQ
jgi:ubiquinol-cytochrome c reductase cytochrome b subunit